MSPYYRVCGGAIIEGLVRADDTEDYADTTIEIAAIKQANPK